MIVVLASRILRRLSVTRRRLTYPPVGCADDHTDVKRPRLRRWRASRRCTSTRDGARAGFSAASSRLHSVAERAGPGGGPVRGAAPRADPARGGGGIAEELFTALSECGRASTSVDDFREGQVAGSCTWRRRAARAGPLRSRGWYERAALSRPRLVAADAFARACRSASRPRRHRPGAEPTRAASSCAPATARILVDLSHLNEAGFWDVQVTSDAPLVATHSQLARTLCSVAESHDPQLDAIAIAAVSSASTSPSVPARGRPQRRGARSRRSCGTSTTSSRAWASTTSRSAPTSTRTIPEELGGVSGLPKLVQALRDAGYDDGALAKLTHENWLRVLAATWHDPETPEPGSHPRTVSVGPEPGSLFNQVREFQVFGRRAKKAAGLQHHDALAVWLNTSFVVKTVPRPGVLAEAAHPSR